MLGRAEGASRVDARGWLGLFPSRSPCPEPFGFAQDRLRRMDQDDDVSQDLLHPLTVQHAAGMIAGHPSLVHLNYRLVLGYRTRSFRSVTTTKQRFPCSTASV